MKRSSLSEAAAVLGRKGGKSKSPAKLQALAVNRKLGGWPKGKPREERPAS